MPSKSKGASNTSAPTQRPILHTASSPHSDPPSPRQETVMPDFMEELLHSLRNEMAAIFQTELQAALNENLTSIKTELQSIKSKLSVSISNIKSDLSALKHTVGEMETSLSTCTDDIVSLQAKVDHLSAEPLKVDRKCEDLVSRSRRNNIRIIGVPEDSSISFTTTAISSMLKEALNLEKEPLLDRVHRTLQPKPRPGERPRPIIARLHSHMDCVDILRWARAQQRIKTADMMISVFPDYTVKTVRARAAFTDIRRQLRDIPGIRFRLLYQARLRVTYDGVEREFNSLEDARSFIKTLTKLLSLTKTNEMTKTKIEITFSLTEINKNSN
uniref:L1 transposable element RRM domain-containing protein n=1 Tax=Sphaeramia orbicularis TaxID=375764 RepID=A0A672YIG4_9TELE